MQNEIKKYIAREKQSIGRLYGKEIIKSWKKDKHIPIDEKYDAGYYRALENIGEFIKGLK